MAVDTERQELHDLVDRMTTAQVRMARTLVASIVSPVDRSLTNAPIDDEPLSAEERDWLESRMKSGQQNGLVSLDEVLADIGLSMAQFEEAVKVAETQARG